MIRKTALAGEERDALMDPDLPARTTSSLFDAVAAEHRRSVLECLSSSSSEVFSVSELADYVAANRPPVADAEQAAVRLHHVSLPKLDDVGLLEYDPRSRSVRYRGNSRVADLLDYVRKLG